MFPWNWVFMRPSWRDRLGSVLLACCCLSVLLRLLVTFRTAIIVSWRRLQCDVLAKMPCNCCISCIFFLLPSNSLGNGISVVLLCRCLRFVVFVVQLSRSLQSGVFVVLPSRCLRIEIFVVLIHETSVFTPGFFCNAKNSNNLCAGIDTLEMILKSLFL